MTKRTEDMTFDELQDAIFGADVMARARRAEELRSEITKLLEYVSRIDSLEGLLKSVKRLQD